MLHAQGQIPSRAVRLPLLAASPGATSAALRALAPLTACAAPVRAAGGIAGQAGPAQRVGHSTSAALVTGRSAAPSAGPVTSPSTTPSAGLAAAVRGAAPG